MLCLIYLHSVPRPEKNISCPAPPRPEAKKCCPVHPCSLYIFVQMLEWSFVFSRLAQKSTGQICLGFLACLTQTLSMKILPTSCPRICACSKKSKDLLTLFTLQGVGWEMTVIRGRVVHSHKEQRGILKLHFTSFERDCLICIVN